MKEEMKKKMKEDGSENENEADFMEEDETEEE